MKEHKNINTHNLWEELLNSNHDAFKQLYQKYYHSLIAYGAKVYFDENIIKDAIQDVFINIWKKHKTLPQVQNVRLYLFKSLRNRLYSLLKSTKITEQEIEDSSIVVESPEKLIILSELKKEQLFKLRFYLQHLPIHQREPIHLKFFQNLTIEEIAELMNIKKQSVSNNIHRGLNTLRTKFTHHKPTSLNKKFKSQ